MNKENFLRVENIKARAESFDQITRWASLVIALLCALLSDRYFSGGSVIRSVIVFVAVAVLVPFIALCGLSVFRRREYDEYMSVRLLRHWRNLLEYAGVPNAKPENLRTLAEYTADINAKNDTEGFTALMLVAANNPNPEALRVLIEAGANVNAKSTKGGTALMFASVFTKNPETVKILIEAGADLNAENDEGNTALILSCVYSRAEIAKILIEAGANLNHTNKHGATALMFSAGRNDIEILRLLIDAGADTALKDESGKTALDHAKNDTAREILSSKQKER